VREERLTLDMASGNKAIRGRFVPVFSFYPHTCQSYPVDQSSPSSPFSTCQSKANGVFHAGPCLRSSTGRRCIAEEEVRLPSVLGCSGA